ncbi:MAG TPA: HAMP domain-containing histidine kinase [Spirochaetes bacterium]|nr:HAMP domain-containing histidine kinase [Spirochaetota bacterium]
MRIPKEELTKIKEPFYTANREHPGTGLGLSVSTRIIEEHSGELEIESEPGKGTTVRVSLPAKRRK